MGLFVAGEGLLLLLAVGGLVARYVPPHQGWWLQLLAVGLPLLVVPLVAAAFVASQVSWGSLAVLNGIVAVLIVARLVHVDVGGGPNASPALTVVTYNAGGFRDAPPAREELRGVFATVKPEVVAWQEVSVHRLADSTAAAVLPGVLREGIGGLSHSVPQLDLAPVSARRSEPVSTSLEATAEEVVFPPQPEREGYSGSATRTQLVWQGRAFALYNVHLRSFNERPRPASWTAWLRPSTWREAAAAMRTTFLQQEQEVVRLREALEDERLPYLICGDLNSTPSNWAYARLAEGLTDAYAAAGTGLGATYHPRRPLVRIDYVLASEEWEVLEARVLPVYASDHLPVLARLHLRPGFD
jgi:endonuclease/exonuclease/phosphatase family metal-dependent hydrolase